MNSQEDTTTSPTWMTTPEDAPDSLDVALKAREMLRNIGDTLRGITSEGGKFVKTQQTISTMQRKHQENQLKNIKTLEELSNKVSPEKAVFGVFNRMQQAFGKYQTDHRAMMFKRGTGGFIDRMGDLYDDAKKAKERTNRSTLSQLWNTKELNSSSRTVSTLKSQIDAEVERMSKRASYAHMDTSAIHDEVLSKTKLGEKYKKALENEYRAKVKTGIVKSPEQVKQDVTDKNEQIAKAARNAGVTQLNTVTRVERALATIEKHQEKIQEIDTKLTQKYGQAFSGQELDSVKHNDPEYAKIDQLQSQIEKLTETFQRVSQNSTEKGTISDTDKPIPKPIIEKSAPTIGGVTVGRAANSLKQSNDLSAPKTKASILPKSRKASIIPQDKFQYKEIESNPLEKPLDRIAKATESILLFLNKNEKKKKKSIFASMFTGVENTAKKIINSLTGIIPSIFGSVGLKSLGSLGLTAGAVAGGVGLYDVTKNMHEDTTKDGKRMGFFQSKSGNPLRSRAGFYGESALSGAGIGAKVGSLFGPEGTAIGAGVGALGGLAYAAFIDFKPEIMKGIEKIKSSVKQFIDMPKKAFDAAIGNAKSAYQTVQSAFSSAVSSVESTFGAIKNTLTTKFAGPIKFIESTIDAITGSVKDFVNGYINFVTAIPRLFEKLVSEAAGKLGKVGSWIMEELRGKPVPVANNQKVQDTKVKTTTLQKNSEVAAKKKETPNVIVAPSNNVSNTVNNSKTAMIGSYATRDSEKTIRHPMAISAYGI